MDWITGIQQAIDYIETHLTEEIAYDKIASKCFSSSYHVQRIFSLLCGYTLGEYIRFRRLSMAGEELANGKAKVIDVALKYGYDSPDSFGKAFLKFHGITPSQARMDGSTLKSFSRLSIKISLEGGSTMNYRIEEKAAFYVLEKVETHSIENGQNLTSIPAFWSRAATDGTLTALEKLTCDSTHTFGICYNNPTENAQTFDYSIAVKCNEETIAPAGFRKKLIPDRTWVIFQCVGAMPNAMQDTWKKIISEFFPTSDYQPTYEMDIESYTQGDMDSPDYRSEIWVPIAKK
ncbi:MAG: AraC family transcriptional regulator [Clostridiales bacterium]|nr:AraC family transcriptional regulator [Clostridiales bacterium]